MTPWLVSGVQIAFVVWVVRHPLDRWLRGWTSGSVVVLIEIAVGLLLTWLLFSITAKFRRD